MAYLSGYASAFSGDTSVVDSSAQHPLRTRAVDAEGNEYIYLKGVASCAVGSWVTFDEAGTTTLAVANAQGRVALALAAVDSTSEYGWFQIYGSATGLCLASFADNGKVFLTATGGSVDDTDVAGDAVIGAIGRSARDTTTGTSTFELNYPVVMDLAVD